MTGFVVDAGAILHVVSNGIEVADAHELLAPTPLRSQTLSTLHEAVHRGEISVDAAHDHLARIQGMSIRLLGDAVLPRRAWEVADELGWESTYDTEYISLTLLQAAAFMTQDENVAHLASKESSRRRRSTICARDLSASRPGWPTREAVESQRMPGRWPN